MQKRRRNTVARLADSPVAFASDEDRAYVLTAAIQKGPRWSYRLWRLSPTGAVTSCARVDALYDKSPSMLVVGSRVLFTAADALYESRNDGPAKQIRLGLRAPVHVPSRKRGPSLIGGASTLRTELTGVGSDGGGGIWVVGREVKTPAKPWLQQTAALRCFYSKDGARFTRVRWTHDKDAADVYVVGSSTRGVLVATHDRLYALGPKGKITPLGRPLAGQRVVGAAVTSRGTLVASLWTAGVRRSTNDGKTWKAVRVNDDRIKPMLSTATGAVVAAGEKVWISRDDGESYSPVRLRIGAASANALAEVSAELLIAASGLFRMPLS